MERDAAIFCESCGAKITAHDNFCESCGHPVPRPVPMPAQVTVPSVATPPHLPPRPRAVHPPQANSLPADPPPVQPPQTQEVRPLSTSRSFPVGILILTGFLLLGAGLIGYGVGKFPLLRSWFDRFLPASPSTVTTSPPSTLPTTFPTVTPSPVASPVSPLDDFVGNWVVMGQTPGEPTPIVRLWRTPEGVAGSIHDNQIVLTTWDGNKLTGVLVTAEQRLPLSAELNGDRSQITFTLSPPESELEMMVALRQKDEPGVAPEASSSGLLSEEAAIDQVRALPPVADWLALVARQAPANQTLFEVVEQTADHYLIRAFEVVNLPGEPSHTATFGWYRVDRTTGTVMEVTP